MELELLVASAAIEWSWIQMNYVAGSVDEDESPMVLCNKAPATGVSHASYKSAVCVSCNKLPVTYKEGSLMYIQLLIYEKL